MEVFLETNTEITELFLQLMEDISEAKTTISATISAIKDKMDMRQLSTEGGRENTTTCEEDTNEATNLKSTKTSQQDENTADAISKSGRSLDLSSSDGSFTETNELIQDEFLPPTAINWILPSPKELSKYEVKEPIQSGFMQANQKRPFEEADKGGVFEQTPKRFLDTAQNLKTSLWVYKKMKIVQIKTGQG